MIRFYEINHGDNLTNLKAPCVVKVRNSGTYHWYNGWSAPDTEHTQIPKALGEHIEKYYKAHIDAETFKRAIRIGYYPVTGGIDENTFPNTQAQLIGDHWFMPKWGSKTLKTIMDILEGKSDEKS